MLAVTVTWWDLMIKCASGILNVRFTFLLPVLYFFCLRRNYLTINKIRSKINKLNLKWEQRGKSLTRGWAYGPAMLPLTLQDDNRGQPRLHPSPSVLLLPAPPSCSIVLWWPGCSMWPSHPRFIWKGPDTIDISRSSLKRPVSVFTDNLVSECKHTYSVSKNTSKKMTQWEQWMAKIYLVMKVHFHPEWSWSAITETFEMKQKEQ